VAFSNYLEDEITGWINGTTFDAAPTSTFIQLYSQDPTESGSATGALYTRVAVAASGWTRVTSGTATLSNTEVITITSSAPSGATATHVAVFDSSTGGNMLFYGLLNASKVIAAGNEVKFNASTLVLSVSALLLDLYPNAAAAFSLRKLRTAYAGSAIRVRRSSDNTEQDIGFVAGQLDTVSLLAFCGVGNGFVTTWYDQSGNARNATNSTAANQPQIVSSGVVILTNTKPSLLFNGATQRFDLPTISFTLNSISFVCVIKSNTLVNNGFAFSNPDSNRIYLGYIVSSISYCGYADSATKFNLGESTTNQELLELYAGTNVNAYKNTVASTQVTSSTASDNGQDLSIGSYQQGSFILGFYNGNIQEIIFYTTNQIANRTGIESNINTNYAIY
jgi:hypothetical protein